MTAEYLALTPDKTDPARVVHGWDKNLHRAQHRCAHLASKHVYKEINLWRRITNTNGSRTYQNLGNQNELPRAILSEYFDLTPIPPQRRK